MKTKGLFYVLFMLVSVVFGQQTSKTKVVLITLDGFRWQELFQGADSLLIAHPDYTKDSASLKKRFWRTTIEERRTALMPFFWNEVVKMGQMLGNRSIGSRFDLTNKLLFSYPGYNEILSGFADDQRITSNDKFNNPNQTVLEIVNNHPKHKGKVAAFGSWDVFDFIVNEERSGIPVNSGFEPAKGDSLTSRERFLNEIQLKIPSPWGSVRLDAFTHYYALEYMKKKHPDLIYIAYGETDDFAHDGSYEDYLLSANRTDAMIKEIWEFTQKDPYYQSNTQFIITTDHGRGTQPLDTWRNHGSDVPNANQVWCLTFGSGVIPLGEVKNGSYFSTQIAPSILKALQIVKDKNKMKASSIW
jgi:hypothetical protein